MEIWIGRDGQRHGPYPEDDVRQWLRSGQLAREDLGWYEGLADWQPLSVLFPDALAATAPPPATVPPPLTTTVALEDYAGFWKRVVAYIIDAIVLYVPNLLIIAAFGGALRKPPCNSRCWPPGPIHRRCSPPTATTTRPCARRSA